MFPSVVELSSLDGSNGFVLNGVDSGDGSGIVSSAGDFNGDGFADLVIGASGADPNSIYRAGASYVVFGTSNPTISIELSSLDGSNGFVLNGVESGDSSGFSVSSAGDFNGDGFADLIIGAVSADPNSISGAGESYVVFGTGNPSSSIELSDLDGNNGFVFNGIDSGDSSGFSVSSAGDFNGDGFADLIIGARDADPNSISGAGESYVVFGTSNPSSSIELSDLYGNNGFVLNGIYSGDASGSSVSNAGDFNGDGLADLIIGARFADPNGNTNAGESYVVFGTSYSNYSIELSSLDGKNGFVLKGVNEFDHSGWSVSSAGDFNGDGLADLIIAARDADPNGNVNAGESYIVFGTSYSNYSIELSSLDGNNGFVLKGVNEFDYSGFSVSSAGDVNGDGLDDLIMGAHFADPNGNVNAGKSYVVFGTSNPSSSIELSSLDGNNGFVLKGIYSGDASGLSVSSSGDFNGDGIADLIIGAPYADPNSNTNAGESYVLFGRNFNTDEDTPFTTSSAIANDTDPDGDPITITAIDTTGTLGIVINNGDGTFDYDPNGQFASLNYRESATDTFSYTISDGTDIDAATVTITILGVNDPPIANDDSFNTDEDTAFTTSSAIANDIDLNGDPLNVTSIDTTGTLGIVINNGDGTFDYDPDGQFEFLNPGETATDTFTYQVSDGIDTETATVAVIINGVEDAPVANDDSIFPAAFELSSLDGGNSFVIKGIDANDSSGFSVSSAEDFNGDGLADIIIGAYHADPNDKTNAGESYVVFGTSNPSAYLELSSLDGSNGFVLNGIDPFDDSGRAVSSAEDFNGDGLADIIIGARRADSNFYDSGESYVVFGTNNPSASVELSSLDGNNGFVLNGINPADRAGVSVSNAGDVNGDGLDDLIIGSYNADSNTSNSGASYVVFGTSNPSASVELSSLDGNNGFVLKGIDAGDNSGRSVSNAGDVNGDGLTDLIIGADRADPNANESGESYVVFSASNVGSSFELSSLDGSNGFVLNGIDFFELSGSSVRV